MLGMWKTYKQHLFLIVLEAGRSKIKASWFIDVHLFLCVLTGWKGRGVFRVFFIKARIPFTRTNASPPNRFPKAPPSNTNTWRVRASRYEFGG